MKPESISPPDFQEVPYAFFREQIALPHELDMPSAFRRVSTGIARCKEEYFEFLSLFNAGFVAGDRIMAGVGNQQEPTLMNSFIQPLADCIKGMEHGRPGIFQAGEMAAENLRHGAGVSYDFSDIRPKGALVKSNGAKASGPIAVMRMMASMASAVENATGTQPPQMAVLRCDHPDIFDFVEAKAPFNLQSYGLSTKHVKVAQGIMDANPDFASSLRALHNQFGRMNLTVSVSDEFMQAVKADQEIDLIHEKPPADDGAKMKMVGDKVFYIYRTVSAKDLWQKILKNSYEWDGLGVLFADAVNRSNNLRSIERLRACSSTGDMVLPSNGSSDAGSLNLARFVLNPFTEAGVFDFKKLAMCVGSSVKLLDRALDKTTWNNSIQQSEALSKRRIGLGYFGLADVFAMLGYAYGSKESVRLTLRIGKTMAEAAYRASIELAKEDGPFPLFDAEEYLAAGTFASRLPSSIKNEIREHGIRNSHLLSIAPNELGALSFGNNASPGCEPIKALSSQVQVVSKQGEPQTCVLEQAAFHHAKKMGARCNTDVWLTSEKIPVHAHLSVLRAATKHLDSSGCKTVYVPADYSHSEFQELFMQAYNMGLMGLHASTLKRVGHS